jgi:dGTPase
LAIEDPAVRVRAPYGSDPAASRGRLFPESASPTRSEFQRDRDRIIHSTAFRRLAHKTQVFVPLDGDHFRTRLTHTIEVGQIARALARALALDEDLAEAVALAHDLGHTPFGHAGEHALQRCMEAYGGFDHNAQALRVVTLLERRYARYDGLDLTFETLEGLVKHNGPLRGPRSNRALAPYVAEFDALFPLELDSFAGAEAQAAALADDIAYDAHDIDDGLRAGLFSLEDIAAVPFIGVMLDEIRAVYGALERTRVIHELGRRVITRFVEDAIIQSEKRLRLVGAKSVEDVRRAGVATIAFSPPMAEADRSIKAFLFPKMYRHEKVVGVWDRAEQVISRLFPVYFDDPAQMPPEWAELARVEESAARARHVADYIAGMTDRYALGEYRKLFGEKMSLG